MYIYWYISINIVINNGTGSAHGLLWRSLLAYDSGSLFFPILLTLEKFGGGCIESLDLLMHGTALDSFPILLILEKFGGLHKRHTEGFCSEGCKSKIEFSVTVFVAQVTALENTAPKGNLQKMS